MAAWWLNGAHDVFAGGSFDIRCTGESIKIRNINMKWEWHDQIDANSFWEGHNWPENKIPHIIEGTYDLIVDKILSADFGVIVKWKGFNTEEQISPRAPSIPK